MNNLALRVFWANSPMPINEKIENPDVILNVPFGNVLVLGSGGGDAPVKSVNNKTGDVVLNAEDVGADETGTAQDFANQAATNLENEVNELKKLIENSGGGSSVEWVKADQVGVIHSNITPSITVGSETMHLEFAKIGGLLWMRGGVTLKELAMSAGYPEYITPSFVTFNNDYKMQALEKGGAMLTIAVTPNAFTTDGSLTRVLFWSDRVCMNQTQAITAVQSLNATSNLYAYSTLRIFPCCIGVLVDQSQN